MNKIIYIADPMCSWCFGFSSEFEKLRSALPKYSFELVMGGLRAGPDAQLLDNRLAQELSHHWQKVTTMTGQAINNKIIEQVGQFVYDTEPACRAVTLMGEAAPKHQFDYLLAIQQAFYLSSQDITKPEVLAELASPWLAADFFLELFSSEAIIEATEQDFHLSRQWQVFSYPTLVYSTEDRMILLSQGYAKADAIEEGIKQIERQLAEQQAEDQ